MTQDLQDSCRCWISYARSRPDQTSKRKNPVNPENPVNPVPL